MNRVILMGHLGLDPESAPDRTWARLRIATNERYRKTVGDELRIIEHTEWHDVKAFGAQAQACAQFLRKGSQVLVEGKIRARKSDDGRIFRDILADSVTFLGGGRESKTASQDDAVPMGDA